MPGKIIPSGNEILFLNWPVYGRWRSRGRAGRCLWVTAALKTVRAETERQNKGVLYASLAFGRHAQVHMVEVKQRCSQAAVYQWVVSHFWGGG